MALKRISTVDKEPVSLEEAKSFLRIDHDVENELINTLIQSARVSIESYTSRSLLRQKWMLTINCGFALAKSDQKYLSGIKSKGVAGIEFPRSPFIELTSLPALIVNHDEKDIENFRVDESGSTAKIHFGDNTLVNSCTSGSIKLEFIAGYDSETLPAPLKQAVLLILSHLYNNRPAVNDNVSMLIDNSVVTLIKPYKIYRLG